MGELDTKLERCFQAVLPEVQDLRAARADKTAGWDSTMLVTLMSVVEEEFGITVEAEELEGWTSYEKVRAYVAGQVRGD